MVAEWFYWLTSEIGRCFNNATLMREHTYEEDMVTGVWALWFFIICLFLLAVCGFAMWIITERRSNERISDRSR